MLYQLQKEVRLDPTHHSTGFECAPHNTEHSGLRIAPKGWRHWEFLLYLLLLTQKKDVSLSARLLSHPFFVCIKRLDILPASYLSFTELFMPYKNVRRYILSLSGKINKTQL